MPKAGKIKFLWVQKVKDKNKTKEQLTRELAEMRQRITELETLETGRKH